MGSREGSHRRQRRIVATCVFFSLVLDMHIARMDGGFSRHSRLDGAKLLDDIPHKRPRVWVLIPAPPKQLGKLYRHLNC